jgi:hypothetical protein
VLVMAAVDIGLAKEEADPRQDDEVPYFDAIMQSLSEEDRARAEADPLDVLIIVRGYKGETPRKEGTLEAMRNICEWRKRVGYHDFFASKLPGHDEFHRYWPESIHGCDKYGHVLLCLRASEVDADSLEQVPSVAALHISTRHNLTVICFLAYFAHQATP